MSRTRTLVVEIMGRRISMTAPSNYIIPKALARGGLANHEPETMACAVALCEKRTGSFVDVGANIGIFSLVLATALGRQCHAFEPTPQMVAVIRDVAARHALSIVVHEMALSKFRGTAPLYLSSKSDSSNSLNRRFRPHAGSLEVAVALLDDIDVGQPALLKIDTESTEPDVLEGAVSTIRTHRPPIICEALPGRTEGRLNGFLQGHGYCAYHITPELHSRRYDQIQPDRSKHYNWIFSPDPLDDEHWTRAAWWRKQLIA